MELGVQAEKCNCTTHCQKGVEPMGDCICRLPGITITAYCDVCDPTHTKFTWHNNGACISCVRNAREAKKQANALRHAQIMAAPPSNNDYTQIEEAQIITEPGNPALQFGAPTPRPTQPLILGVERPPSPDASNSALMEMIVRVNGIDLPITRDLERIKRMLMVN